jgi:hypothetical protein
VFHFPLWGNRAQNCSQMGSMMCGGKAGTERLLLWVASRTPQMIEHPCPLYIRPHSLLAEALRREASKSSPSPPERTSRCPLRDSASRRRRLLPSSKVARFIRNSSLCATLAGTPRRRGRSLSHTSLYFVLRSPASSSTAPACYLPKCPEEYVRNGASGLHRSESSEVHASRKFDE